MKMDVDEEKVRLRMKELVNYDGYLPGLIRLRMPFGTSHYYTDNKDLKSERHEFQYYFGNELFCFTTDNGVFSKENIDYGSYILIKSIYSLNLKIAPVYEHKFLSFQILQCYTNSLLNVSFIHEESNTYYNLGYYNNNSFL